MKVQLFMKAKTTSIKECKNMHVNSDQFDKIQSENIHGYLFKRTARTNYRDTHISIRKFTKSRISKNDQ